MKHIFHITLFLSICFFACKRESVEPVHHNVGPIDNTIDNTIDPPNYDHYNGNFYCLRDYVFSYSDVAIFIINAGSDKVVQMQVVNDSIFFNGYSGIPIDSVNQTFFSSGLNPENPNESLNFTYSNDFNTININQTYSGEASPYINTTYDGDRSDLLMTDNPHPYLNEIQGDYLLTKTFWDSNLGIETVETDTFFVSIDGSTILVDNEQYSAGTYIHSYCDLYDYSTFSLPDFTEREFSVSLGDTFELHQFFIEKTEFDQFPDTTEVHYVGGPL